jgi:hypothetical protein
VAGAAGFGADDFGSAGLAAVGAVVFAVPAGSFEVAGLAAVAGFVVVVPAVLLAGAVDVVVLGGAVDVVLGGAVDVVLAGAVDVVLAGAVDVVLLVAAGLVAVVLGAVFGVAAGPVGVDVVCPCAGCSGATASATTVNQAASPPLPSPIGRTSAERRVG